MRKTKLTVADGIRRAGVHVVSVVEESAIDVRKDKLDVLRFRKRLRLADDAILAGPDDFDEVLLELGNLWCATERDGRVEDSHYGIV